jgi:small-conductance mechanosensitive channel
MIPTKVDSLWWDTSFLQGLELTPLAIFRAVLILVGAYIFSALLRRALALTAIRSEIDPGVRYSLGRLLNLFILFVAGIAALRTVGVDLGSLAVIAGALGIGIGFGLQGIAANFVAGLVLLFERPIRVGDRISLGTLDSDAVTTINGYVRAIRLRATTVLTPDNITLIVPNQDLVTRTVVNWSLNELKIRMRLAMSVAHDSDLDHVRRVMHDVAIAHPETLKDPAPEVRLIDAADSRLQFQLLVWIGDPRRRGRIESDLRWTLVERFRAEGIVIPFPMSEVRLVGAELGTAGPRPDDSRGDST